MLHEVGDSVNTLSTPRRLLFVMLHRPPGDQSILGISHEPERNIVTNRSNDHAQAAVSRIMQGLPWRPIPFLELSLPIFQAYIQ